MSLVPDTDELTNVDETDDVCTPSHCFHAFDALYCSLTSSKPVPAEFPDDKYPLFVTWNTHKPGRHTRLRGCIGNFDPMPLHAGLAEYALISAFRDHRFKKIEKSELPTLECEISLLTDFEDATSYLDWTVGVHGIYISFAHPSLLSSESSGAPSPMASTGNLPRITSKQTFTATYLPDVIPAQGWDKIEAVDSAIQKAGWNGLITEDLRRSVKLRRYQSRHCTVNWDEYVEWRKSHGHKVSAGL